MKEGGDLTLLSVVWKNIRRRKARSALTAAGVSIGVGAGIAMAAISWGFERSFENLYLARSTDAVVAKITSGSLMPGFFDEARAGDISALPGVRSAGTALTDFFTIQGAEGVMVCGWQPGSFLWDHLSMREGARPPGNAKEPLACLGAVAADLLKKKPGDPLLIKGSAFRVSGIFESNSLMENGAVIILLPQLQDLVGRPNKINFLNLRLNRNMTGREIESLRVTIERKFRGLRFFRTGEVAPILTAVKASKAMSITTTAIALALGTLGIFNTVLMGVHERRREIGLLAAVGWRRSRIVAMLVIESAIISLAGALAGIVLALLALRTVQAFGSVHGRLEAECSAGLLLAACATAVVLGGIAAIFPALKAASIQPRKALDRG